MVDLPCIIETHKTFDNSSFYKSGDISQILIVKDNTTTDTSISSSFDYNASVLTNNIRGKSQLSKETKEEAKISNPVDTWPPALRYPHGITPPAYNIRPNRFERTPPPYVMFFSSFLLFFYMYLPNFML